MRIVIGLLIFAVIFRFFQILVDLQYFELVALIAGLVGFLIYAFSALVLAQEGKSVISRTTFTVTETKPDKRTKTGYRTDIDTINCSPEQIRANQGNGKNMLLASRKYFKASLYISIPFFLAVIWYDHVNYETFLIAKPVYAYNNPGIASEKKEITSDLESETDYAIEKKFINDAGEIKSIFIPINNYYKLKGLKVTDTGNKKKMLKVQSRLIDYPDFQYISHDQIVDTKSKQFDKHISRAVNAYIRKNKKELKGFRLKQAKSDLSK